MDATESGQACMTVLSCGNEISLFVWVAACTHAVTVALCRANKDNTDVPLSAVSSAAETANKVGCKRERERERERGREREREREKGERITIAPAKRCRFLRQVRAGRSQLAAAKRRFADPRSAKPENSEIL